MTDRTQTFVSLLQDEMKKHNVAALRSTGIPGEQTFVIEFADAMDSFEVMHIRKDAIFDTEIELSATLNPEQKSFVSAVQGLMNSKQCIAIQATAVSAKNQGLAFMLDMNNPTDTVELSFIGQDEAREAPVQRSGEETPHDVPVNTIQKFSGCELLYDLTGHKIEVFKPNGEVALRLWRIPDNPGGFDLALAGYYIEINNPTGVDFVPVEDSSEFV